MIKSVTIVNYLGEELKVVLTEEEPVHGFLITQIDGLGPPKATINTTDYAANDGAFYNSSRAASRNIVLSLRFIKADSIESTRQRTYKYFPIKHSVSLIFETDNRNAIISGFVESNEPNIFSDQEGSQISIICPDPFFYKFGEDSSTFVPFETVEKEFEFPFSNESLDTPLIEFGNISNNQFVDVDYDGDSEIGVLFSLVFRGDARGISIFNETTNETINFDPEMVTREVWDPVEQEYVVETGMLPGDVVTISTVRGDKYVSLTRAGEKQNVLNAFTRNSKWIHLDKGVNSFAFQVEDGAQNVSLSLMYETVYEGI